MQISDNVLRYLNNITMDNIWKETFKKLEFLPAKLNAVEFINSVLNFKTIVLKLAPKEWQGEVGTTENNSFAKFFYLNVTKWRR